MSATIGLDPHGGTKANGHPESYPENSLDVQAKSSHCLEVSACPKELPDSPNSVPGTPSKEGNSFLSRSMDDSFQQLSTPVSSTQQTESDRNRVTPSSSAKKLSEEEKQRRKEERRKNQEDKQMMLEERAEQKKKKKEEQERKRLEMEEAKKKKKEEKELKEQKKLEELRLKEEKRLKREEETKAKQEEKRKKDDERQKEETAKKQALEKIKQKFTNFFIKLPKDSKDTPQARTSVTSTARFTMEEERTAAMQSLDELIDSQDWTCLYLDELRSRRCRHKGLRRVSRCRSRNEDDVLLLQHPSAQRFCAKLLQFHDNIRPPYYGTWRKTSLNVGPRCPFGKDTKWLNYEVDSDEEWEDEGSGESVGKSDDEDEAEAGDEEGEEGDYIHDEFFVPHNYLSDDEREDDGGLALTPEKKKVLASAKHMKWVKDFKQKKAPLQPVVFGPLWDERVEVFLRFQIVVFTETPITTCPPADGAELSAGEVGVSGSARKSKSECNSVPEEAMPHLVRLVHANPVGLKAIIREFLHYWEQVHAKLAAGGEGQAGSRIAKAQLKKRIREMATYATNEKELGNKTRLWWVHPEVLVKYQLEHLPVPNNWLFQSAPLAAKGGPAACPERVCAVSRSPGITSFMRPKALNEKENHVAKSEPGSKRKSGAEGAEPKRVRLL